VGVISTNTNTICLGYNIRSRNATLYTGTLHVVGNVINTGICFYYKWKECTFDDCETGCIGVHCNLIIDNYTMWDNYVIKSYNVCDWYKYRTSE